jgi:hypothetical protein
MEGDQFVLGHEWKILIFKQVVSEITPTSCTQALYQGEVGKELKRLSTIYATKLAETAPSKR